LDWPNEQIDFQDKASRLFEEYPSFEEEANQTTSQLKTKVEEERRQFNKLKALEGPCEVKAKEQPDDSLLEVDFEEILTMTSKPPKKKSKRQTTEFGFY